MGNQQPATQQKYDFEWCGFDSRSLTEAWELRCGYGSPKPAGPRVGPRHAKREHPGRPLEPDFVTGILI